MDPTPGRAPERASGALSGRGETALLRAVLHLLFASWGLTVREAAAVLGGIPLRSVFEWRERPEAVEIDPALRHRLSCLLALHKLLRRVDPARAAQAARLRASTGDGRAPLAVLMDGRIADIRAVHRTLRREVEGDTRTTVGDSR